MPLGYTRPQLPVRFSIPGVRRTGDLRTAIKIARGELLLRRAGSPPLSTAEIVALARR
jgi:hypothetical protein